MLHCIYVPHLFIHSSVDGHLLLLSSFSPQSLASSRTQLSECLTCITAFNCHLQPGSKARRYQTPFLHMGALRFRDAKESTESHTAPWRQHQNQIPRPRRHACSPSQQRCALSWQHPDALGWSCGRGLLRAPPGASDVSPWLAVACR